MFDNICSLPLRSDIFAQAIHPTVPLFTVGLSSGRVQTFRLPPIGDDTAAQPLPTSSIHSVKSNGTSGGSIISESRGRRSSENGFDVVETVWETRRHKGSCRALAFSGDGETLYSAGTDGVVKVAQAETGRVKQKMRVPDFGSRSTTDAPSLLNVLSPQTLLLGTDTGRLHVYDLRTADGPPSQTLRPHITPSDPTYSEPLTSLTPLPPTASSTSGTCRSWVTTSGSTLAVCDLRKGVVKVSEDQGDVLLSSACISGLGMSKKRRRRMGGETVGNGEKVLVGGAGGVLTLWERGEWEDQSGRVVLFRGAAGGEDDGTVDALAVMPEDVALANRGFGGKMVVAGLGNGAVTFVKLRGGGGEVVGEVRHDETGVEGVSTLGFDVGGRMISGGGQIVKLWHQKLANEDVEEEEEEEQNADSDDDGNGTVPADGADSDDEDDEEEKEQEDSDSDDAPQQKKKRKKGRGKQKGAGSGIAAFSGMD